MINLPSSIITFLLTMTLVLAVDLNYMKEKDHRLRSLTKCEEGQTQCVGHYGPGGDGDELLDEDLEWCCDSCNCKDLSDVATGSTCTTNCEEGQRQCVGHYGPGGDGDELLDEDLEWCCDSCNCKDLSDVATGSTCTTKCEEGQTQCVGHYGPGGDGNELLDEDLEWCCDSCNCKDLSDSGPGGACVDNEYFFIKNKSRTKDCSWVGKNPEKRCRKKNVIENCPYSCDACDQNGEQVCENDKFNKKVCKSISCCRWRKGECRSSIGRDVCFSSTSQ